MSPESKPLILTEIKDRVALLRLNRPEAMNALNRALMVELMDTLERLDSDDSVGVFVITGDARAFAAGADIKEMMDYSSTEILQKGHISPFDRIRKVGKPVIAAVSGWCLGGGNELALSCDLIVASESARFGQPEINLGVIPGAGGTQRLTRAIGKALAMEMVLNNRTLSAEEALRCGLVNRVVPVERCRLPPRSRHALRLQCVWARRWSTAPWRRTLGMELPRSARLSTSYSPPRTRRKGCAPSTRSANRNGKGSNVPRPTSNVKDKAQSNVQMAKVIPPALILNK